MKKLAIILTLVTICQFSEAQKTRTITWVTNTDESKVPEYTLPDPLMCKDGSKVTNVKEWEKKRRPELVDMLTTYMYGKTPELKKLGYEVVSVDNNVYEGLATKKEVNVFLTKKGKDGISIQTNVYTPNGVANAPAFMIIGNMKDPNIIRLLKHGYAVVFYACTSVAPDNLTVFKTGLIPEYYRPGQTTSDPDEWGSIAAWAWTASRIMDYLEKDKDIDASKVAIHGHSRLGKTALWAGASDQRFALVIPAGSGCCGTALSRRMYGETLFDANTAFPHWLCGNFQQFSRREEFMPFDQHEVIALCAPRPVYIAAAEDDQWADPRGEYLAGRACNPVYALYGKTGIAAEQFPAVDQPDQKGTIAYHIRKGGHTVNDYDWEQFIIFADKHLK